MSMCTSTVIRAEVVWSFTCSSRVIGGTSAGTGSGIASTTTGTGGQARTLHEVASITIVTTIAHTFSRSYITVSVLTGRTAGKVGDLTTFSCIC